MSRKRPEVFCDYCGALAEFVDDSVVYGRSLGGKVYLCRPCEAWVGTHSGGRKPKGRLAKAKLRKLKIAAHAAFDPLWWAAARIRGWSISEARNKAYEWLAKSMGIEQKDCHIGMFNEEQCLEVIEICAARRRA